ncbi:MAG: orotate phosphoribosyltransferase [Candidatus Neomarinimicrobiota bacterium]
MKSILEVMKSTGAITEGHFLLTSGRHSGVYLEKFRLLENPEILDDVGRLMAEAFGEEETDVVLGAAVGGVLLSYATARVLKKRGIFAERVDGRLDLRRGFVLHQNERVLIVEDIVTTGGSVEELIQVVEGHRARLVGIACLVDRTEKGVDFGHLTKPLLRYPSVSWESRDCPLCKSGIPIESRGRTGKEEES